jgi:hypothetical protein
MDDLTKRELAIIAAGIITTVVLATVLSWLLVYAFLPSDPRDPLTKAGRPDDASTHDAPGRSSSLGWLSW